MKYTILILHLALPNNKVNLTPKIAGHESVFSKTEITHLSKNAGQSCPLLLIR